MSETILTRPCMACAVGIFEECHNPEVLEDGWIIPCASKFTLVEDLPVKGGNGNGRQPKALEDITDKFSTGRKRAAQMAPIFPGMVCEWSGLKWAGGGIRPIVGCSGTRLFQVKANADLPDEPNVSRAELQHGPDKGVFENTPGVNLHRICASCHHRWHIMNDPGYGGERPDAALQWLPNVPYYRHDPMTKASDEDFELAEQWWGLKPKDRDDYPVGLPPEDRLQYPQEESILTGDNPFEDPSNPFDQP